MGWADGPESFVGTLPRGLPSLAVPSFSADVMRDLLPLALAIGLVSFTGSIAVAKSLTSRRASASGQLGAAWHGRCQRGCRPVWRRGRYRRTEPFTGRLPLAQTR